MANSRPMLYVIQLWKWNRWTKTIWTWHLGAPVSKRAADKALLRAQKAFPKEKYRVALYRPRKRK
jgi:hypothetical protein